jgi:hypothetical protein
VSQATRLRQAPQPRRSQIPWKWVFVVFGFVAVGLVVYFVRAERQLKEDRSRILKRLAGLKGQVQDDFRKMSDQVEGWTVAAATKPYAGDLLDRDARAIAWRERPSIYLRLRVDDAKTRDAVHANAKPVAIDSVASCMLRAKAGGPWPYGDLVTRIEMLGADYIKDVSSTTNDLRMRNLTFALDYYEKTDFPPLRDGVKQAEYLVLVLDEDPPVIPATSAVFANASVAQRIAAVPHPMRLHVFHLTESREILRVRRTPDASVVQVQGDVVGPAAGVELRKAQALGCSFANDAMEVVGGSNVPTMTASAPPVVAAPAPSTSASAIPSTSASAAPSASLSAKP